MSQLLKHRQISLLRILYKKGETISGETLSSDLNVSSRTIRNDVKTINEQSEDLGVQIESVVGRGYFLIVLDENKFDKLVSQQDTIKSVVEIDLQDRLFRELSMIMSNTLYLKRYTYNEMLESLFISESTLRNDLNDISKVYLEKDITITRGKNNQLFLNGNEGALRSNIINIIYRHQNRYSQYSQNYLIDLVPETILNPIKRIVKNEIDRVNFNLSDEGFGILVLHLSVGVLRNKHHIIKSHIQKTQSYLFEESILEEIDKEFSSDLMSDIHFFKPLLLSLNRSINTTTDPQLYEHLEQVVLKGIEDINTKAGINFSNDVVLINGLVLHLSNVMERVALNLTFYNQTVETIKLNYPLAFEIAILFSLTMNEELNLTIDDNELGLIAIHFGGSLERINNRQSTTKKAVIVCGYGLATAMLIQERIKSEFGHQIEIVDILGYSDYLQYDTSHLDFIFTTIPMDQGEVEKMILIDLAMSNSKIHEIEKSIKQTEINNDLRTFFYPELFFKNQSFQNKEEAITFLANKMIEKGFMAEDAITDIFAREQLSSTEIGYSIAIPHYLNVHNDICSIGVMALKKPLLWKNEKVELILLMSLSPTKCGSWERVFRTIYPKITSEAWVKRVVNELSFEGFIDSIKNTQE